MAITFILISFFLCLFTHNVHGLQVTPNSPCASVCIDQPEFDVSDPKSSNTRNSDITCHDRNFDKTPSGQKWKSCMTCLQNSTHYQGSESDQAWFMYNLRYHVAYCVFGFPNATDVGSSPCQTGPACGGLENALKDGNLVPTNITQFSYCDTDGGIMTGASYNKCLACISPGGDRMYVSNALVALEAGCLQRPAPGKYATLSASIFSSQVVTIVDPATIAATPPAAQGPAVSTTIIVVIVLCVLVVVAIVAAFVYIRIRKRRNRLLRSPQPNKEAGESDGPGGGGIGSGQGGIWSHAHHRKQRSSLSFKCVSPRFVPATESIDEDDYSATTESQSQSRHITSNRPALWKPHNAASSFQGAPSAAPSVLSEQSEKAQLQMSSSSTAPPLHPLTTSLPAAPRAAHYSPHAARGSPMSADHYFPSPTSATQLLPSNIAPYNPAEYGAGRSSSPLTTASPSPAPLQTAGGWGVLPTSSPLAQHQQQLRQQSPVARLPSRSGVGAYNAGSSPVSGPGTAAGGPIGLGFADLRKKKSRESGSPIESKQIQMAFPAPPPPPRR